MSEDKSFVLSIRNYQRIRQAELEFVPGLNILQGKSNQGKSAIIRAIETAVYNLTRESHITKGETVSAVGIQFNGHEVIWRRDKKAASKVTYRVDGKILAKVGRGQVEPVAEALGIREIEVNDRKFRVNFAKQMAYPFLLDSTPSEFFKFIVQSGEEGNVTNVLDTMKKDYLAMKNNVTKYEASKDTVGESYKKVAAEYNELKPKLEYARRIIELDSKVAEYKELLRQVETYGNANKNISGYKTDFTKWLLVSEKLEDMVAAVETKKKQLESLNSSLTTYMDSVEKKTYAQQDRLQYQKLIESTAQLFQYRVKLNNVMVIEGQRTSILNSVNQIKSFKDVVEVESVKVKNIKEKILEMDDAVAFVSKSLTSLDSYLSDKKKLREEALEVNRLNNFIADTNVKIGAGERIITEVENELATFNVCPRCGAPIEKGRYHGEHDRIDTEI